MAAKVRQIKDAWWVVVHHAGKRTVRRVGPTKADRKRAAKICEQINASIALGSYRAGVAKEERPLPCDRELRRWHTTYSPAWKPTYRELALGHIENHLIPFFGSKDMREIHEDDLLEFIRTRQEAGRAPGTIHNMLSTLRRVYSLLHRKDLVTRNPASRIGELMRRVARASAPETHEVQAWTRAEAAKLLQVARETEPRFVPMLTLLFSTGMRRGEALGLKWTDVDFDSRQITVRRSITTAGLGTPKSGRSRRVAVTSALAEVLFDLLVERRKDTVARGWREVPEWVFCSEVGTSWEPRNVVRIWARVRRRAQKLGVRPLRLHDTRHTYATLALQAGKSVRWVAEQLGHADPALTLRVYAHAMPEEETDLSFADFSVSAPVAGGIKRHYTAPGENDEGRESANCADLLARPARLERATLSSAS